MDVVTHRSLMLDTIYALQGVESRSFTFDPEHCLFRVSDEMKDVRLPLSCPEPLTSFLQRFGTVATISCRLEKFIDCFNDPSRGGLVSQKFANCLALMFRALQKSIMDVADSFIGTSVSVVSHM